MNHPTGFRQRPDDVTVHRLKLVSGTLLSKEQSQLETYKRKTSALGKKLEGIPSELVMTHAVAELLSTVQNRRENESVRSEMVDAQKRLCQLAARVAAAEREARVDALTQLLNRRAFDEVHATCHAASQETPYCLVMIDIDHFKSINDEYGHAAGDAVLALIGRALPLLLPNRPCGRRPGSFHAEPDRSR